MRAIQAKVAEIDEAILPLQTELCRCAKDASRCRRHRRFMQLQLTYSRVAFLLRWIVARYFGWRPAGVLIGATMYAAVVIVLFPSWTSGFAGLLFGAIASLLCLYCPSDQNVGTAMQSLPYSLKDHEVRYERQVAQIRLLRADLETLGKQRDRFVSILTQSEECESVSFHPAYSDQRDAIDWARRVLRMKRKYVILDTETTGLGTRDEIVQLAVIDLDGNVLFNENIRPTKKRRMSSDAVAVHGLTMAMLSHSPTFAELKRPLQKSIGSRKIIAYNAEFDRRLFRQTWQLAGGFLPKGEWECAMLEYARFVGEWNDYYQGYRWHKLEGGDHSALGDSLAVLELIQAMASAVKLKKWYEFWVGR